MSLMTTPDKPRGGRRGDKPNKRPNRTGKALHCYIDPALRDDIDSLSGALDVDVTALTETALRLLLHTMGRGPRPEKLWLPQQSPVIKEQSDEK